MSDIKITRKGILVLLCLILLLIGWILTSAELAESQDKSSSLNEVTKAELIQIIPKTDYVQFKYPAAGENHFGPWSSSVTLDILVRSHLPEWSAVLEPPKAQGPAGVLPPDRIWVKTEETGQDFQPLTRAVPVLVGDRRLPVRETELEVEVRPTWQDPPGQYEGILTFTPAGPTVALKPSKFSSPRIARKIEKGQLDALPGSHVAPVRRGIPSQVHFSLNIPEILEIALMDAPQLSFEGAGPEGTYVSQQEIRFKVRTNSPHWKVIAVADDLVSEKGEISSDRIRWERVNQFGQVLESGNLGASNVVLSSSTQRVSPDEEQILHFSLDISMADVAGSYKGNISLQGVTGD